MNAGLSSTLRRELELNLINVACRVAGILGLGLFSSHL